MYVCTRLLADITNQAMGIQITEKSRVIHIYNIYRRNSHNKCNATQMFKLLRANIFSIL